MDVEQFLLGLISSAWLFREIRFLRATQQLDEAAREVAAAKRNVAEANRQMTANTQLMKDNEALVQKCSVMMARTFGPLDPSGPPFVPGRSGALPDGRSYCDGVATKISSPDPR